MRNKIAIRTDGSKALGNGHIVRMLALADALTERNIPFIFIIKEDPFWVSKIQKIHKVIELTDQSDISGILVEHQITHFVYDNRNDLNKEEMLTIASESRVKTVAIDTPEDIRLVADTVIYPPVAQVQRWNWEGFKGKLYASWEYVLLRKEFINQVNEKIRVKKNTILLSFGSTDPACFTEKILDQISRSGNWKNQYNFILLCGPQFSRIESISQMSSFKSLNITIHQAPAEVAELYKEADFAIIAFGVTAYELASLNIPFLYVSLTDDHAESGEIFDENGYAVSLGVGDHFKTCLDEKVVAMINKTDLAYQKSDNDSNIHTNTICDWNKIIKAIIE